MSDWSFLFEQQLIYIKLYYHNNRRNMNSYAVFFQSKQLYECQNYLDNLDELFYDHPKQFDPSYEQKNDQDLAPTNFIEKQLTLDSSAGPTFNFIDVSKDALNNYIYVKKGTSNQTMQLLPNFKTFITRKIKDLLIIKVLNRVQTYNCLTFIKNRPSFQSLNSLLGPIEKCKTLRKNLLEFFSSSQVIREVMQSGIRMDQKRKLLKFIDKIREQIQNPGRSGKWKNKGLFKE